VQRHIVGLAAPLLSPVLCMCVCEFVCVCERESACHNILVCFAVTCITLVCVCVCVCERERERKKRDYVQREVGGWGRDPTKCTGRDWGMGASTI